MFSTEARWERIAAGLFWTGWLFVACTAYAIYSRDDWRGVVMTAAPATVLFAGWWLARAHAEYLLTTTKAPRGLTIASTLVIAAGAIALIYQALHPRVVDHPSPETAFTNIRLSPGALEKLTARQHPVVPATEDPTRTPPEGCEEWIRKPDLTGEMIGYCARWK